MTKMAAMPIYGKKLKKSSSPEPKGRWPWNLVGSIGSRVLPAFFKWWPWVDLNLFYDKVKFCPLCFCMGKGKTKDFSETIVHYDLKVATNDRSDKKFLLTSKLCPPLPWGYIHVLNHEKIVQNQTSKRFLWYLQQMGKVIRPLCWHKNFVPWGLSAPAPGLYTCIKSCKKLYKIRLQRDVFFKLATNDQSDKMFLLTYKFHAQGVVSPCPMAIFMYKILKKKL